MDGHPTDDDGREAAQEVHPSTEVGDLAGMGINGQWSGCITSLWDSSYDPVSLEETIGARGCGVSQGDQVQMQPGDQGTSERESEAQGHRDVALSGADALEKKDELGLTGRRPGRSYSQEQRQRILDAVQRLTTQGVSTACALRGLRVPRSTYYFWKSERDRKSRPTAYNALLAHETQSIVSMKEHEAHLSHRHISGLLRRQDVWVSSSTCYRVLKSRGLVWASTLRESPWKTAHYEPFRPNQLWGEDWTGIVIGGLHHYVLTILDLFSKYLLA